MPPTWWPTTRFHKTLLIAPVFIIGFNVLIFAFPDPPVVQQAYVRNHEQRQRQRDEKFVRELERRIDENPAAYGLEWPDDDDKMDNNIENESGASQGRRK